MADIYSNDIGGLMTAQIGMSDAETRRRQVDGQRAVALMQALVQQQGDQGRVRASMYGTDASREVGMRGADVADGNSRRDAEVRRLLGMDQGNVAREQMDYTSRDQGAALANALRIATMQLEAQKEAATAARANEVADLNARLQAQRDVAGINHQGGDANASLFAQLAKAAEQERLMKEDAIDQEAQILQSATKAPPRLWGVRDPSEEATLKAYGEAIAKIPGGTNRLIAVVQPGVGPVITRKAGAVPLPDVNAITEAARRRSPPQTLITPPTPKTIKAGPDGYVDLVAPDGSRAKAKLEHAAGWINQGYALP